MAGLIPQAFINDLLARVDIVDVIEPRLTLKKSGSRYLGLCPFHNEKTPSFNVVPDRQFYYCFGCGATGTALKFLMQHDRLDFVSAVEALAAIAGVEVPREKAARDHAESNRRTYEALAAAEKFYRGALRTHPDATRAVDYLKGRGVSGVVARDFGIGFAPPGWDNLVRALGDFKDAELLAAGLVIERETGGQYDRFRDRIMFPIRDVRGRVIGFGGRVLGDEQPKYLNSPETSVFHKGRELYGLYEARRAVRQLDRLILVEGYMDVVALAQAGVANAVATLGTATGGTHFEKLYRYVPDVVCCFDGDNAGREAAWKALAVALPSLSVGRLLSFVFLPERDDPDSLVRREGRSAFEARVRGAVSAAEYLFQRLSRGIDLGALDGRARLADLAMPYISQVPEGALRALMVQKLAEMTQLAPDQLSRGASGSPVRNPLPARAAGRPVVESSRLQSLILAVLIQRPELFHSLESSLRQELIALEDSLLGRVARYLEEHPECDTAGVLGYWAGEDDFGQLVTYAQRALILEGPALKKELEDAVSQWLAARSKANREALLEALREEGTLEKLEAYWQLKNRTE
jgi:DNA primase